MPDGSRSYEPQADAYTTATEEPSETADGVPAPDRRWGLTAVVVVGLSAFIALFVRVGSDAYWAVTMGDDIVRRGHLLTGIPFAAAPSGGWPNAVVLAELIMSGVHALGDRALPIGQVVVSALTMLTLAVGARRLGASDRATAWVVGLVALGSLPTLVIVRLQTLSLIPFALLLLLLRADERRPSRRIWLAPLLVAMWTNLHGAVLLGVATIGAYLILSRVRLRPAETIGVGLTVVVALVATPAGIATVRYYTGVADNEASQRGTGLWARLSPTQPFDVLLIVVAAILVLAILFHRRLPVWEYAVLAGLAIGTAAAARYGVWLLFTAAAPAAVSLTRHRGPRTGVPSAQRGVIGAAALLSCVISVLVVLARGNDSLAADPALVTAVAGRVGGSVVLAPEPLAESLAQAGVKIWAGDPIDAFHHDVQRAYLDFNAGGGPDAQTAIDHAGAVVVEKDTGPAHLMAHVDGFTEQSLGSSWILYLRRS